MKQGGFFGVTLVPALALMALAAPEQRSLVIQAGAVIDTRTGRVLENRTVVVQGDRITRIGAADAVAAPPNAEIFDARGRWLIPGLVDMHVHGSSRADVPLALYVANGVTAIPDLGGPLAPLQRVRQEIERGSRIAPNDTGTPGVAADWADMDDLLSLFNARGRPYVFDGRRGAAV